MTDIASRRIRPPIRDSYGSIVGELERVEHQARARRLAAASEADRIRTAAHATADEIAASVPGRIGAALAELRARHAEAAEAEIADIVSRLAEAPGSPSGAPGSPGSPGGTPARAVPDAAVELLVAAVLGEPAAREAG